MLFILQGFGIVIIFVAYYLQYFLIENIDNLVSSLVGSFS